MIQTENTTLAVAQALITLRDENKALKAEVERLKSKLELVRKHIIDNRNALLFVLKTEHDRATYCEYAFCQSLLEIINSVTPEKGGEDE